MEVHMKGWLMKGPNNIKNTKRRSNLLFKLFHGKWKKYFFVLYAPPCSSRLESPFRFVSLEYYYDETLCNKKASIDVTDCTEIKSNLNMNGMRNVFSFVGSIGAQKTTFTLSASDVSSIEVWISKMEHVLDLKSFKTSSLLFTSTRLLNNSKLDNSATKSNNKYRHTCYCGTYTYEQDISRSLDQINQEETNQKYLTGLPIENIKDKTDETDITIRETRKHRNTFPQTTIQKKAQSDPIEMLETHADQKTENNFFLHSSKKMRNVIFSQFKRKNIPTQSDTLNSHHRSNTTTDFASNNSVFTQMSNNSFNQMSNQHFNGLLYHMNTNNYIEKLKNLDSNKACKHAYTQTSNTDGTPVNFSLKRSVTFSTYLQSTILRMKNKNEKNRTHFDLKRKRHEQDLITNNCTVSNTANKTRPKCTSDLFVSNTAAIATPNRFHITTPNINSTKAITIDEVSNTAADVTFGGKTIFKDSNKQPISVSDQTLNLNKHLNKPHSQQIKCNTLEKQQPGKNNNCIQSCHKPTHDLQHQESLDIVIPCEEKKNVRYEHRGIFKVYQQPHYKRPVRVSPNTNFSNQYQYPKIKLKFKQNTYHD